MSMFGAVDLSSLAPATKPAGSSGATPSPATGDRPRHNRLVEGARTNGWKQALGALALNYPERINPYL